MKKVLSIVLAVLMVMGTLTVAGFAYDETQLPIFPAKTEGRIYFAAENTPIPAGAGTYDVPVYLVSNYTPDVALTEDAFVELGFMASITGDTNNYATINSVTIASEVQALNGYATLDADFYADSDECHIITDCVYVAFAAGVEALNQTKLKVATINVTISEGFPGGDYAPFITLNEYDFGLVPVGVYSNIDDSILAGVIYDIPFLPEYTEDYYLSDDLGIEPSVVFTPGRYEDSELVGEIFFEAAALYEKPAEPSWTDNLLFWVKKTVFAIFARIEDLHRQMEADFALIRGVLDMFIKGDVVLDPPVEEPAE